MFRILFLMFLLLAGLVAGPYIAGHQGYVRIETDTKVIQMSIVMLVVFFVTMMAVVYSIEGVLKSFFKLSKGSYLWFFNRKRKKAQRQTLEGLVKMSEGNYSKAEKLIGKNAKHSDKPVLNFIKAAEAAQKKGDEKAANKYLIEASKIAGNNNIALEIARAKILMLQKKLPAARTAIDSLLELAPRNSEVLSLAIPIYQKSGAYLAVDHILEDIKHQNILTNDDYINLERWVDDGLLDEKLHEEGQEGLLKWWGEQPSRRNKSVYARVGLIKRLIDSDDHESAQRLAFETVKKFKDPELELLFDELTRLEMAEKSRLLKLLVKRGKKAVEQYSDDYARIVGYALVREGQFTQAKPHFIQLLEHKECNANDRIMASYVAEHTLDEELSAQIHSLNLKEVNVKEVEPVLALPKKVG
ncbi:heme biosynthesis HemY N-terminal domain-containing protein [Phocoenobacter skyensis]|uniref:HemY protein n=1 Tax=Phocoenobacter skyensis TaxID=97481 RepID=A0A1H7UUT4_9PAST|nr:heme biosynthesis HemY N-terminal domain-containing protein [Pasteurella skyensis]MDP8078582.1 heme biosynthesis HemY N-terminal domain-containing protein [Pasteurella skyensis]MDP8084326.1 heme biosynthesis HemY N-terminal domain-containing protein [Pasteurella skyensis]MDP8170610.1 heme biosynthesis HemY N-terminal domain-containing protein [Pasteurella skyensis]MDP8174767.1 heme biosynthesis HemY N-terminal domain-containing protein [Pasteurella skyensis]MDP8184658.1 heme biosynthesis He